MKRLAIIPTVFTFVACLALLGCGDIAGPSVEAPQFDFTQVGDPTPDRDGNSATCRKLLGTRNNLGVVTETIPALVGCPPGFEPDKG